MAISFPRNIKLNDNLPLDTRTVVENSAARLALDYTYEGLIVFEQDTKKLYVAVQEDSNSTLSWRDIEGGEAGSPLLRGYYLNGEFYSDSTYQTLLEHNDQKIYIDNNSFNFYQWSAAAGYKPAAPTASDLAPGLVKLYNQHGTNTDGTMTQKSITEGIGSIKFDTEAIGDIDGDGEEDYMLVLDLPWD